MKTVKPSKKELSQKHSDSQIKVTIISQGYKHIGLGEAPLVAVGEYIPVRRTA